MKKDWEIKKLGELCEFRRGLTYSKNDEVENSSNAVLRSNNIDLITNQLDLSEIKFISDKIKIDDTKKVKRNSLLICTANGSKAHLGKVALIDGDYDFGFGGFMGLLIPSESVYPRFFYYALISENYKKFIKSLSDGANINNLKFQDLSKFEIPVPPLEEQNRIVKILDEKFAQLESLKANAQTNLQNAKDLFQSQLTKAFGNTTWEKKRLGDVITLLSGQDFPPERYNAENKGIPYITGASNFNEDGSILINRWTDTPTVIAKRLDVLLVVKGSGYGKTTIADFEEAHIARQIMALRVSPDLERSFLFYYLNCKFDEIKQKGNGVIPGITRSDVLEMSLNLPPLPEQKRIVKELDTLSEKVRQLQEIYTKQIANCDELKQAYLQKAFEGEL